MQDVKARTAHATLVGIARSVIPPLAWRALHERLPHQFTADAELYKPNFLPWGEPWFEDLFRQASPRPSTLQRWGTIWQALSQAMNVDGDIVQDGGRAGAISDLLRGALRANGGRIIHKLEGFDAAGDPQLCFAHINLESCDDVRQSLKRVYPHMSRRGVIVLDGYGFVSHRSARKVIDEFFTGKPEYPLALTTGQCVVHKI